MSITLVKLGNLCTIVRGSSPRPKGDSRYYGGDVPRLMVADVTRDGKFVTPEIDFLTDEGAKKSRPMKKGDFIVAVSGQPGQPLILAVDACIHDGFAGLRNLNTTQINKNYLFHFMIHIKEKFESTAVGAIFKNLTTEQIRELEIPLPTLKEQKRIATILDKADAIRRKRQQAIKLADEFLRSVFLDMFGDPITNPKGWDLKPLKKMAKITTGNTPPRDKLEYYGNDIEWIKSDNINTPSHFLTCAKEYLSHHGVSAGRVVPVGSILITCIAGSFNCIGNVAITDRPVAFNQQINALTPKSHINSWFLYGLILFSKKKIQATSTNSMKGMISKGNMEDIEFICPPFDDQNKFENIFSYHSKVINSLNNLAEESSRLFYSLSQKVFSGKL